MKKFALATVQEVPFQKYSALFLLDCILLFCYSDIGSSSRMQPLLPDLIGLPNS